MKARILVLACLSILAAVPVFAQSKTVTNADLEKYRQKRLQAEKDYRENYERMGFPSPEELQRQLERDRVEREALSARLTSERIQREQLAAEQAQAEAHYREQTTHAVPDNFVYDNLESYYGFPNFVYQGGRVWRGGGWRNYNYPVPIRVGNGIPIINYNGGTRPLVTRPRWRR